MNDFLFLFRTLCREWNPWDILLLYIEKHRGILLHGSAGITVQTLEGTEEDPGLLESMPRPL